MVAVRWLAPFVTVALGLVVVGCSAPAPAAPTAAPAAPKAAPTQAPAPAPAKAGEKVVRITMARALNYFPLWGIEPFAAKYGLKPDFVTAGTNAEMQRSVQTSQVEVAALGYQTPAILADQSASGVKIVAGIYKGGQNLIVRKGLELKSWKDLEGKKIGRPPGTYVNILFTLAAGVNGVDLNKVNLVETTPAGTTELAALKSGDLDGFLLWSPIIDKAVVDGYGYYPSCCDIGATKEFGPGNQVMGVSPDFLKDRPTAINFLKAYVESVEFYEKNQDKAVDVAVQVTGADKAAVVEALKHAERDYRLDKQTAINVAKQGPKFGFTKTDMSDKVADYLDYSYLAEATGKPVEQLNTFGR